MKAVIILTLIIILIIICVNLANKETFFNDLIQKEVVEFDESFAMTAFDEGNDTINVYKFSVTPILGSPRQAKLTGPELGFYHEEIIKNKMDSAVSTKNSVKYVDNSKMVPYLFAMIKRLVKQVTSLQTQINELATIVER
jgi:hypothetical protein